MKITRHRLRNWTVYDAAGALVCLYLYNKGALEVAQRLSAADGDGDGAPAPDSRSFVVPSPAAPRDSWGCSVRFRVGK